MVTAAAERGRWVYERANDLARKHVRLSYRCLSLLLIASCQADASQPTPMIRAVKGHFDIQAQVGSLAASRLEQIAATRKE